MTIQKASVRDVADVAELAVQLWPGNTLAEMMAEFAVLIDEKDTAVFVAFEDGLPIGFSQCQLRHDYVEGTSSSPVGYLEGIFVREECRLKGCARALLSACEAWAAEKNCAEFASDCELTNHSSTQFHLRAGFEEANRIICFIKKL